MQLFINLTEGIILDNSTKLKNMPHSLVKSIFSPKFSKFIYDHTAKMAAIKIIDFSNFFRYQNKRLSRNVYIAPSP